ncbi:MAG: RcnB family protein, partial [Sphingomonas sp.]
MRILRNAGLTMVTALAFAGAANAQRLGGNAGAGIPQQPGGGMPVMAPPMGDAPQAGAHFPAPGPMQGGGQWHGSHGGQWSGGHWSGGQRRGRPAGRWGGSIGGHWSGGANAPGGWNAYHHPQRGWALPGYWIAPSFYIDDFWSYGLSQPPEGYRWSRYYDDAVLIDDRGRVWDSMDGVDWDGADRGGHTDYIFSEHGHDGAYPPPPMVYRGPAGPNGGSYTTTTT